MPLVRRDHGRRLRAARPVHGLALPVLSMHVDAVLIPDGLGRGSGIGIGRSASDSSSESDSDTPRHI